MLITIINQSFKIFYFYIITIYIVDKREPATQAFIHVVNTPAKKALNTISARSFLRVGAIALRPPN